MSLHQITCRRGLAALAAGATIAASVGAPPADAAWPGRNGQVAFVGAHHFEDGPEPLGTGIWLRRPGGHPLRRLTADPSDRHPAFSPDGRWIAFSRGTAPADRYRVYPRRAIFLIRSDGSGLRRLTDGASEDLDPSFAAGGRRVLFARSPAGGRLGDDIYSVGLDGEGLRRRARLLIAPYRCAGCPIHRSAAFSPDGRSLLAAAGRNFRYFLVRVPLRFPRASRALHPGFAGRQDAIEPAWQPLPGR